MKKKITEEQIKKIKELRRQGYTIKNISKILGLSKSTVFYYVYDIKNWRRFKNTAKRAASNDIKYFFRKIIK